MDWSGKEQRRTLMTIRRVVMWLVALADLAECSASRSAAIRFAVLWLLRPGEAIALDYLGDLTGGRPDRIAEAARVADVSPAGALALARSFRAIAMALLALVEEAVLLAPDCMDAPRSAVPFARRTLAAIRFRSLAVEGLDSS